MEIYGPLYYLPNELKIHILNFINNARDYVNACLAMNLKCSCFDVYEASLTFGMLKQHDFMEYIFLKTHDITYQWRFEFIPLHWNWDDKRWIEIKLFNGAWPLAFPSAFKETNYALKRNGIWYRRHKNSNEFMDIPHYIPPYKEWKQHFMLSHKHDEDRVIFFF